MDNLRSAIDVLFCRTNPEIVIQTFLADNMEDLTNLISKNRFVDLGETLENGRNKDELRAVYEMICKSWAKPPIMYGSHAKPVMNVFFVLLYFVEKVLLEVSDKPVCEFSQLLRWRILSQKLGEDIFTTAFLAHKDIECKRERHYFSWEPTLKTNNYYLQELLGRGVTDLHFHLFGSSINFNLSWLSLMNDIVGRAETFKQLKPLRMPEPALWPGERGLSLYAMCIKACAIRQMIFKAIISKSEKIDKLYFRILVASFDEELSLYTSELQSENEILRYSYGLRYDGEVVDYAIRKNMLPINTENSSYLNTVLYGERWLMYKMFYYIFVNRSIAVQLRPFFYAYLIIKAKLRKELIQMNRYPGFYNFKEYQSRKALFLQDKPHYMRLLVKMSVANTLNKPNMRYLEARITPKMRLQDNKEMIDTYDRILKKEFLPPDGERVLSTSVKPEYYYVFHFLKGEMAKYNHSGGLEQWGLNRHYELRKKVKEQAMAINLMRRSLSDIKDRVIGIDAASAEIGCRPEVFAQAFRYLKQYSSERDHFFLDKAHLAKLGCTYHVGEDFLDVGDGLRAIDEVIRFLNFKRGDRLGHCLALGVDPNTFYQSRHSCIILPKQDLLDNVVWLYFRIKQYGIPVSQSLLIELEVKFRQLFQDVYSSYKKEVSLEVYYLSWLLRGDDPELYADEKILSNADGYMPLTYWERCGLNFFADENALHSLNDEFLDARNNEMARLLYKHYHFNPDVKMRGQDMQEYKIGADYVCMIEALQKAMQFDIAHRHLVIECTPTSNLMIGSYLRYQDHPISKFFNLGLTLEAKSIRNCAQLSVSLNTDDLGVFATDIENEYALMAIAMEKAVQDQEGGYHSRMVYDWLERIRVMGFEQKFKK